MSKKAFTLIELLVVIAIIALLVSILMPSLRRAKELAMRTNCVLRVSGLGRACFLYAGDNNGYNPWRDRDRAVMPHCMYQGSWGGYDLNKYFLEPYAGSREAAFCPSRLMEARNPDNYTYEYVTYQYNNIADASGSWLYDKHPDLTRIDAAKQRYALWGCMTLHLTDSDSWLGHDSPFTRMAPKGQSNVFTDGSGEFVLFDGLDVFWALPAYGQDWYWAIPG